MPLHLIKLISLSLSFCLIFEQTAFAQAIDLSRYFVNSGKPIIHSDKFRPLHLRYLGYDNLGQDFKLLLDKGDTKKEDLENKTYIEENTQTLLKYFFIGLALPNEKFWVNLRPDAPDNIIDDDLAKTDIGRIFLESDVQLKKDTAQFTSPQTKEGKAYWDKLYKRAGELFGSENITIPTLTRPWIVPNEIIIREAPDSAYIYKATLKVMLEEDYLRGMKDEGRGAIINYSSKDPRLKELNEYSTQLIRELIIPQLTYQVNTSKRYAPLRQVYYSLILAQWFKQKYGLQSAVSGPQSAEQNNPYIKLIDSGDLTNLASKEPYDKQDYFKQYQKSFQDGEYNLTEPVYTPYGQSIRRYVSGGIKIISSPITIEADSTMSNDHAQYLLPVKVGNRDISFASSAVEEGRVSPRVTIGGNAKGGKLGKFFLGDVFIRQGKIEYKVWCNGQQAYYQLLDINRSPVGEVRMFAMEKIIYLFDKVSMRVVFADGRIYYIGIEDEGAIHGTTIDFVEIEKNIGETRRQRYIHEQNVYKYIDLSYDGLHWKSPRTFFDFIVKAISYSDYSWVQTPSYYGLFDSDEKKELIKEVRDAWDKEESLTSMGRSTSEELEEVEDKWNSYFVAGTQVYGSKALMDLKTKEDFFKDGKRGRISFSVYMPKVAEFFNYMMQQLIFGVLKDIPVGFKTYDVHPSCQGNGENAHLYFESNNEAQVYEALTKVIYPYLEKNGLISLGGRFLMIPIQDDAGRILKGIDFGQGIHWRQEFISFPERNKLVKEESTGGVIHMVSGLMNKRFYLEPSLMGRFKRIIQEKRPSALMQDNDFKKFYSELRQSLSRLRRDIDYPILDIDGKKLFPNFTKLIKGASNEIILTSKVGGKPYETIDYLKTGPIHITLKLGNSTFGIYKYMDIPKYYRDRWHLSDKKDYFIIEESGRGDRFQYIDDRELVGLVKISEKNHIRITRIGDKFSLYVFGDEEAVVRYNSASSAVENKDSQVPPYWDMDWKLPGQKAQEYAAAFIQFFKNELLSDKKILDGDMSWRYEYFIEDYVEEYDGKGMRPAAEILKALYWKDRKLAAAIIGSIRTHSNHIFWSLALLSLETPISHKLIDEAIGMNLKNEAILIDGVKYSPDYAGFDLAGALLLMPEDMFKKLLSGLSEAGQSFIIAYAFDFLNERGCAGRLDEKAVLKVLNFLLVNNPGLSHRLSNRTVKLLKLSLSVRPVDAIAITPVTIENVEGEDDFKKINSLLPLKIYAMSEYLGFLERLMQNAYEDVYNAEYMRSLAVSIGNVLRYWEKGDYDFALDQWREAEDVIISIRNDNDAKRRKVALESKRVFLIEHFMKQLNMLWADFLFQRGLTVSALAVGATVGKLRVITDAVVKDPDFWRGLKEDEIAVVTDFPPNISLINPPRGAINTLASGITSHASVRAKKWNIPCAGLYSASMDMLANLDGQWAVLEASFPKGILRKASAMEIANYSRPARVSEKIKVSSVNISNESPDIITEYAQGIEQYLGLKAVNQLFLQGKEIGAKVPRSIGVTYKIFKDILTSPENAKSKDKINNLLNNIDKTNNSAMIESLGGIRELILNLEIAKDIETEILSSIREYIPNMKELMIRLATNSDDLPDYPGVGAGTYGSYICEEISLRAVTRAMLNAYASLFSYDAFIEREVYDISHHEVFPSILIQEFIPADYSFGVHTVHPVSGDENRMLIEIVQGLGPGLRDRQVPGLPYQFIYDKKSKEIIEVVPATKTLKIVYVSDGIDGFHIIKEADPGKDVFLKIEGPAMAKRIAESGMLIERLIQKGQDIEGAIVIRDGLPDMYIVQSRKQIIPSVSSALETIVPKDNLGGIAFNALPIQTEAVASSALGSFPGAKAFQGDLNAEWAQIQAVFNAGIRPSVQRISEYTVAAASSGLAGDRIDQVRSMLADILRSEEEDERLLPVEPALKNLITALES